MGLRSNVVPGSCKAGARDQAVGGGREWGVGRQLRSEAGRQ